MVEVSRKLAFTVLQALVAVEGAVVLVLGAVVFLAAAGGDPTVLAIASLLLLLGGSYLYLSFALKSRASTPFFGAIVASLVTILLASSVGEVPALRYGAIGLAVALVAVLALMRGRFQLRPGEFVKEEKLPPEAIAKVATKVRGVRCRECGDDDVWITRDRALVCKNCGSLDA